MRMPSDQYLAPGLWRQLGDLREAKTASGAVRPNATRIDVSWVSVCLQLRWRHFIRDGARRRRQEDRRRPLAVAAQAVVGRRAVSARQSMLEPGTIASRSMTEPT